jgi:hypothetical protein
MISIELHMVGLHLLHSQKSILHSRITLEGDVEEVEILPTCHFHWRIYDGVHLFNLSCTNLMALVEIIFSVH